MYYNLYTTNTTDKAEMVAYAPLPTAKSKMASYVKEDAVGEIADRMWDVFTAFLEVGFNEDQAMELTVEMLGKVS